eukprot:scaffold105976_cov46-Phaeocystis_antarctica.AAC.1
MHLLPAAAASAASPTAWGDHQQDQRPKREHDPFADTLGSAAAPATAPVAVPAAAAASPRSPDAALGKTLVTVRHAAGSATATAHDSTGESADSWQLATLSSAGGGLAAGGETLDPHLNPDLDLGTSLDTAHLDLGPCGPAGSMDPLLGTDLSLLDSLADSGGGDGSAAAALPDREARRVTVAWGGGGAEAVRASN